MMNKKHEDRHLDVPAEANRDKHINFISEERGEKDPANEPPTGALAKDKTDKKKNNGSGRRNND